MTDNKREAEDRTVLTEIVTAEKTVEHPTKGRITFRIPTLEIQRKIDAVARAKKKMLRDATDRVPDPEAPNGYRIVPAYKSKEVLAKEYEALGWWTDENEQRARELNGKYSSLVTKLELLGFESEHQIYRDLIDKQFRLLKLFENNSDSLVKSTIASITSVDKPLDYGETKFIKEQATSTEVDDILIDIEILRTLYDTYVDLAKLHAEVMNLESERTSLFSDSWQEQLQYYVRLAQVYYCSTYTDTNKPLYESVDTLEKETDLEFIRWIFTELQAFWQGITDETRERLSKYDFTGRLNSEKSSSEESPVQPESSKDGDSVEKLPTPSTEVLDTTDQSPKSN